MIQSIQTDPETTQMIVIKTAVIATYHMFKQREDVKYTQGRYLLIYVFKIYLFTLERTHVHEWGEGPRERERSQADPPTEHRTHSEAQSQDTKIMAEPKSRSWTFK